MTKRTDKALDRALKAEAAGDIRSALVAYYDYIVLRRADARAGRHSDDPRRADADRLGRLYDANAHLLARP